MFVQVSPSSSDLGETTCSLNFATRVRGIEQGPARKQADPAESFKLKQIVMFIAAFFLQLVISCYCTKLAL
jgi:hypothetical protein